MKNILFFIAQGRSLSYAYTGHANGQKWLALCSVTYQTAGQSQVAVNVIYFQI
jgi:hypothetical protein